MPSDHHITIEGKKWLLRFTTLRGDAAGWTFFDGAARPRILIDENARGWITEIEIHFSSTQGQRNWCSIAQGATSSFTLNAQTSFMLVRPNNFFAQSEHRYTGSGGTVTLSTNPLP